MGVLGNIWVKLGLKSDDFRKGMDQSEQRVSKFGQATQKMSMMANAAWLAVGAAVIKFGKESVKAYNEQMAANAKLQNAIKNTNGALGLSYRELEKYASQIQSSFNVADDAAMNAMATMTTFGSVTGKMFKDAMQAAVDMAAFMGSDLTAEVKRLGLALEVPEIGVTQLRRAGIAFTNEQIAGIKKLLAEGKKYEAQMIILEGVQKKFGGAAAEQAKTSQGAWTQAKNALGDYMETLGRGIEKTKGLANFLKDVIEYRNAITSSEHLSKWEKFWGVWGLSSTQQKVYAKMLEAQKAEDKSLKAIEDSAQKAIEKYQTLEQVQTRIAQIESRKHDKNSVSQAVQIELKELGLLEDKLQGLIIKRGEEEEAARLAAEASAKAAAEEAARSVQLINHIEDQIAALEEKKNAATSISEIAAINDEIAALNKLKEGYESVSAAMLEMGRTPLPSVSGVNITGGVTATTQPKGVDIDALTKKYGKQKKEVQEIEKSFMRITDAIYRISYSGLELGEMLGLDPDLIRGFNALIGSVLDMVDAANLLQDALDGVAKGGSDTADAMADASASVGNASMGIVSAFFAIASAMLKIGTAIADMKNAREDAKIEAYIDDVNKRLETLQRNLENIANITGIGDSWFTEDNFNNVRMLVDSIKEAIIGAQQFADAMEQSFIGIPDMIKANETFKALQEGYAALKGKLDMGGLTFDVGEIDKLIELAEQFKDSGKLTEQAAADVDAFIAAMKEAEKYYDELGSTISSMVVDISGTLYDTVTVEWKKIWMENRDAGIDSFEGIAEAAKKNIADIMESIVTQQIWASVMAPVFDQLGTDLTNTIISGGDITGVFDSFFSGFDSQLNGYYDLLDQFYTDAEARGWEFSNPNDTGTGAGSTSEEDALDKLVEKQRLLNELHKQWIELYGQETADAMLAGMGADADSYVKALEDSIAELDALREAGTITDEQLRQLQDFQAQLLDIRDAAKQAAEEAAAEAKAASQEAYNAWSANLQAGLDGAANEYERLLAYEAAIKAAIEDTSMSEEDRAAAIEAATKAQAELYKQVREGLESTYATEDDKWAAQQEKYRRDIEWATQNGLPALAQKIQDTWDDEVIKRSTDALDEWKGTVDEALSGVESNRVAAIMKMQEDEAAQALASGGMVSIEKLMYYAKLLEAEQKNLNEKYETEEEKHLDTLAEFDSDYNDAKLLGDEELMAKILAQREEYNNKYIQQQKDTASAEAQALLEGSEEYKALTGDLAKLGVDEARKALDAYRKMVENSEDLSGEAKAEILAGLDEIQEKIDDIELDNLQQQFEDIQSVISSISSILGSFGASSELTEGLSGLSNVIGGLFSVISGGTWVDKFAGIASMIGGIVTVAKSLKDLFSDGNEDLTAGVTELSTAYQKLVGIMNKAFGDNKTALQNQAIDNIKAQIAEYERLINAEEAKGNGFWARLFGNDTDEELVENYKKAIDELYTQLGNYDEEIKNDFLQTDTDSFVNELRDIWAQSYDSAEDYYKALENLNNKTIDNMIARWIEKKLVEDQVNSALNRLYESGMTDSAFDLFASEIEQISNNAKKEYEKWQDAGYFQDEEGGSSMDGSIARTATEAQFNQYLGYVQNLNITAHDILNALSDQPALIDFSALAQISRGIANDVGRIKDNTEYCRMLEGMKNDLAAIRRGSSVAYN